ncbi:MAG: type II secretion system protein [Luteolibacter sp.]|jgi:general secretion pathway protein G|nr:type II secretion system protein [Luteolibacter sp.]
MHTHFRIRGFTLVELLVAITLVIVLAALSFLGLSKWKSKAGAATSMIRVKSIGMLVMTYATEKGELPVWHDYNRGMYWWQLLIEDQEKPDLEQFHSPAHREFDEKNMANTISYGWNYPVIGRHKGDGGYRGDHVLRLSNFDYPEDTLVLADGPRDYCWGFIDPWNNKPDPERYEGKAAALFLDGAVRMLDTPREFTATSKWFKPVRPLLPR